MSEGFCFFAVGNPSVGSILQSVGFRERFFFLELRDGTCRRIGRLHVFFKHEPVKFSEKFLKAYGDPESWIEASGVDVGSDEEVERASSDEEVEDVDDVLGLQRS